MPSAHHDHLIDAKRPVVEFRNEQTEIAAIHRRRATSWLGIA
jgi:hypothetical protein